MAASSILNVERRQGGRASAPQPARRPQRLQRRHDRRADLVGDRSRATRNCALWSSRGAGPVFCAGADSAGWSHGDASAARREHGRCDGGGERCLRRSIGCRCPSSARIQGAAIGGGAGLAAIAISSWPENAVFGFTEVKLGLMPAVIAPRWRRLVIGGPRSVRWPAFHRRAREGDWPRARRRAGGPTRRHRQEGTWTKCSAAVVKRSPREATDPADCPSTFRRRRSADGRSHRGSGGRRWRPESASRSS